MNTYRNILVGIWLCSFVPSAIAMNWLPSFNPITKVQQVREKYLNSKVASCFGAAGLLSATVLSGSGLPLAGFAAFAYYQNSLKLDMERIKNEILAGTQKMLTQVKGEILDGTGQMITASEQAMKNHVTNVAQNLQDIINGNQKENIEKHDLTHDELKKLHALWQSTQEVVNTMNHNVTTLNQDIKTLDQKMNEAIVTEGKITRDHFDKQLNQQYKEICSKYDQASTALTNFNNHIEIFKQLEGAHFTDLVSGITTMHQTMEEQLPSINSQLQVMSSRLGEVENKINGIEKKVDTIENKMDAGFAGVHKLYSEQDILINQILDANEKADIKLTELQKLILGLNERVNAIDNKVDDLHQAVENNAVQTNTKIDSVEKNLAASGRQNAQYIVFAIQNPGQQNPYEHNEEDTVEDVTDTPISTNPLASSSIYQTNQSKINEMLDNSRETLDNTRQTLAIVKNKKRKEGSMYLLNLGAGWLPANSVELKDLEYKWNHPIQRKSSYFSPFDLEKSVLKRTPRNTDNSTPSGFDGNENQIVKPVILLPAQQPINLFRTVSGKRQLPIDSQILTSMQQTNMPLKFVFTQSGNWKLNNQIV